MDNSTITTFEQFEVYLPLTRLWAERDVCWQKAYPILFLSGPGCSTNYHWDPSSVLIVQLCGRKRYHSLKEPRRWCSEETADQGHEAMVRPIGLREDDIFICELEPGDAVWSRRVRLRKRPI
jgi:ribosomal protein L16 Arg81 hydroxylase